MPSSMPIRSWSEKLSNRSPLIWRTHPTEVDGLGYIVKDAYNFFLGKDHKTKGSWENLTHNIVVLRNCLCGGLLQREQLKRWQLLPRKDRIFLSSIPAGAWSLPLQATAFASPQWRQAPRRASDE